MVYFSGDIHGYPWDVKKFCKKHQLTQDDIIVLLGDVGANYYGDHRDSTMKEALAKLPPKILCIHGNHEMRPWHVAGYRLTDWNGGTVSPAVMDGGRMSSPLKRSRHTWRSSSARTTST